MLIIVPLGALALYVHTALPEPGWIDSGELAAVAHTLGIAHPTGSPLYVVLARLMIWMLPGSFFPLTLFSALSVSTALAILGVAANRLAQVDKKNKPRTAFAGAAVALVLATAPTIWYQATINEVYALQVLLFSVFLYLRTHPQNPRGQAISAYVAGLAFANHQSAIFLMPFLIHSLWPEKARLWAWLKVAMFGLAGTTLYLVLPIRATNGPQLNWGGTSSLDAFLRHITGWQYSEWVGGQSAAELSASVSALVGWLYSNFPYAALPIAAYGLYVLVHHRRPFALVGSLSLMVCVIFGINFPNPDVEAFYILAFLIVAMWLGVGLATLMVRSGRFGLAAAAALVVGTGVSVSQNYARMDLSEFSVPTDWVLDALETVEPGSVVLTREWDHYSPWLYLRLVEGVRPDVAWIDTELLRRSWYPDFIRQMYPERYAAAKPALDQLAPFIHDFESGGPYSANDIESAYANAIFSLSLGQPGPVYADGTTDFAQNWGVERRYLASAAEVPWGLLTRLFRPGDTIPELPAVPVYRNVNSSQATNRHTILSLSLYDRARRARVAYLKRQSPISNPR